jgi:(S)-mandelate dehydrogenase
MDARLTFDYVRELRQMWPHRLVIKGILDPEDVSRCIECGADAVWLSNHGGRQLDSAPSAVAVLRRCASPPADRLLVDGGVQRGSDVVKAVALGARAVAIGRAALYGLAAAGEAGVSDLLTIIKDEIDGTLAQIGCPSVQSLTREYIGPS